jgi:predicted nucleic acid-binding protein
LDRLRLGEGVGEAEIVRRREAVYRILDAVTVVDVTRPILARASQALAVSLGTLDAIHLATAMLWREQSAAVLVMATHDAALGLAARSVGFRVIGV